MKRIVFALLTIALLAGCSSRESRIRAYEAECRHLQTLLKDLPEAEHQVNRLKEAELLKVGPDTARAQKWLQDNCDAISLRCARQQERIAAAKRAIDNR